MNLLDYFFRSMNSLKNRSRNLFRGGVVRAAMARGSSSSSVVRAAMAHDHPPVAAVRSWGKSVDLNEPIYRATLWQVGYIIKIAGLALICVRPCLVFQLFINLTRQPCPLSHRTCVFLM